MRICQLFSRGRLSLFAPEPLCCGFWYTDSIESLERCRKFLTFGLESGGILLLRRYRVLMDRCSNLNSLLSMEHECFSLPKTVNAVVQKYSRPLIYYQDSCVE